MYESSLIWLLICFIWGIIGFVAGDAYRKHVQNKYTTLLGIAKARFEEAEAIRKLEALKREQNSIRITGTKPMTYQPAEKKP